MSAKLKQNLKISCTFTAALVGAGFASGQEITLFFGQGSIFTVILAAVFIAFFCYIFLELGRLTKGAIAKNISPTFALCFDTIVKLVNIIVLGVMVAGSEYIVSLATGVIGGGAVTLMLACACVLYGAESIKLINTLIVPIMIGLILIILFKAGGSVIIQGKVSLVRAITYAGMNLVSGGCLVSIMAKDTTARQCREIAVFCFMQILLLLLAVYACINLCSKTVMPLLAQAYKYGLGSAGIVVIFLALFTSMVSALASCSLTNPSRTFVYAILGFLISLFGFQNLINYTYMPIGGIGFAITTCCLIFLLRLSLRNRYPLHRLPHF